MDSDNHALNNARAHLREIVRIVGEIKAMEQDDSAVTRADATKFEELQTEINEMPLSVLVRDGWHAPGAEGDGAGGEAVEYEVLLSTGGPACRIYGELSCNQPSSARLQHQDWFKPWTDVVLTDAETEALLRFAGEFYFGD